MERSWGRTSGLEDNFWTVCVETRGLWRPGKTDETLKAGGRPPEAAGPQAEPQAEPPPRWD